MLSRRASWVNRAGNIDRSACMELRASELWRSIDPAKFKSARTTSGRQARASITINTAFIFKLHQSRFPRTLIGDQRTPKSNAMKTLRDPAPPPPGFPAPPDFPPPAPDSPPPQLQEPSPENLGDGGGAAPPSQAARSALGRVG